MPKSKVGNKRVLVNGKYLNNLRFVDDIIIISKNTDELQLTMKELEEASNQYANKTQIMTSDPNTNIVIGKKMLQVVANNIFKNRTEKEVN